MQFSRIERDCRQQLGQFFVADLQGHDLGRAITYYGPFTEPKLYAMPAGGRRYIRPPSLISLRSTAPFLKTTVWALSAGVDQQVGQSRPQTPCIAGDFDNDAAASIKSANFSVSLGDRIWITAVCPLPLGGQDAAACRQSIVGSRNREKRKQWGELLSGKRAALSVASSSVWNDDEPGWIISRNSSARPRKSASTAARPVGELVLRQDGTLHRILHFMIRFVSHEELSQTLGCAPQLERGVAAGKH
jgi:hypothetical protein